MSNLLTVETHKQDAKDVKQQDSMAKSAKDNRTCIFPPYLQKTNFTTLGILREGFLVSPAVIPSDSVPPSAMVLIEYLIAKHIAYVHAKLAVTNTLANPPNPPTNGAPGICQFFVPMNSCSWLAPTLTAMPKMMNTTTVAIFSEDSQYSTHRLLPGRLLYD